MPKTLVQKMQDAVEAGDFELAKTISAKIKKQNKPIKKKGFTEPKISKGGQNPPNKGSNRPPAPKGSGVKSKKKQKIQEIEVDETDEGSYIAPAQNDSDTGEGRRISRTEPFQRQKRTNLFVDNLKEAKEDLGIALTRPIKSKRTKYKEVSCVCNGCGRTVKVSPALARRGGDDGMVFKCNRCCGGGGRR